MPSLGSECQRLVRDIFFLRGNFPACLLLLWRCVVQCIYLEYVRKADMQPFTQSSVLVVYALYLAFKSINPDV